MLDGPTLQNVLFELGTLPVAEPGTLTTVARTAIQPSSKPATQEQPHAQGRSCHLDVEKEARVPSPAWAAVQVQRPPASRCRTAAMGPLPRRLCLGAGVKGSAQSTRIKYT